MLAYLKNAAGWLAVLALLSCSIFPGGSSELWLVAKSKFQTPEWLATVPPSVFSRTGARVAYVFETKKRSADLQGFLREAEALGRQKIEGSLLAKLTDACKSPAFSEFVQSTVQIEDIYFESWQSSDFFSDDLMHRAYFLFVFTEEDLKRLKSTTQCNGDL